MLEIKIRINKKLKGEMETFYFPESFTELNIEQWTAYFSFVTEEIGIGELLWAFMGGDEKFKAQLPGSRIADLEHLLKFLYNEPAPEWYMKHITLNGCELIGPAAEFSNMTCGEFAFADTYYSAFREMPIGSAEAERFVNKCLAVLMREVDPLANELAPDWKGDRRIVFNENHVDRRAAIIALLPIDWKMAAMFNYSIIRSLLEKRYIWIFQKSSSEGSGKNSGWDKVMRSMCFGDITKLQEIFFVPLYTFFDELNDGIKANSK